MEIVGLELLAEFSKRHASARKPLKRWVNVVQEANWNTLLDVKQTFSAVDYKSEKYIFDIKGNDYRLVCEIVFAARMVFVMYMLTHAEYSKLAL